MKKATGLKYLILALLAFAGLGLEVLLAFVLEPLMYGSSNHRVNGDQERGFHTRAEKAT